MRIAIYGTILVGNKFSSVSENRSVAKARCSFNVCRRDYSPENATDGWEIIRNHKLTRVELIKTLSALESHDVTCFSLLCNIVHCIFLCLAFSAQIGRQLASFSRDVFVWRPFVRKWAAQSFFNHMCLSQRDGVSVSVRESDDAIKINSRE